LDSVESDYLETLAGLIVSYERARHPLPKATPLDVLKHLMEQRAMRPSDLGKLIGNSSASMVLRGQRELSKAHIRVLADHFHVSPAVFL
jgi:HTH-type transcriptional regulator/antitoxin HigA